MGYDAGSVTPVDLPLDLVLGNVPAKVCCKNFVGLLKSVVAVQTKLHYMLFETSR